MRIHAQMEPHGRIPVPPRRHTRSRAGATRIPQSRPAHRTMATPPPRCQDHRCLGEHIRLTARKKRMGAHPHRTHALGGIASLPHRSAHHQPPYAGDSGTREPLSATLGSRGLSDRTRWWGHFQVLRLGGRVRSHRSRRRPVKWRSGPTCAQVNGFFACKGVGGVGLGRSGPECRWRRGRRAHPAASRAQLRMEGCGGEWFGVPVPRLFLCVGAVHPNCRQCTSSVRVHRHVTGAPPRNGCTAT